MGKKRFRKAYNSKGQRPNVSNNAKVKPSVIDRELNKLDALKKKKRVCFSVPNPDSSNTKERMIRVCSNGR